MEGSSRSSDVPGLSAKEVPEPPAAEWLEFWGKEIICTGGLLDQVFKSLHILEQSWDGLKRLPDVGSSHDNGRSTAGRLVASYIKYVFV